MKHMREINDKPALPLREAVDLERGFAVFELSLTDAELTVLKNLKVSAKDSYDNFGVVDLLEKDAARFLVSIGNTPDESEAAAKVVDKISRNILAAFKAEAAWITIRAFLPTSEYDIPRWHQDGRFYKTFDGKQKKAAVALSGDSTLFKDATDDILTEFNALSRKIGYDSPDRKKTLSTFVETIPTVTAGEGQGAIFTVGSDNSALHSEPPIHTTRVFLSVVPGSKEQIEELRHLWKKKETSYTH